MLNWALLISMVALGHCWVLDVNEKRVAKKLTNNVTFHCYYDGKDNEEATLAHVSRIRLLKFKTGDTWVSVASMTDYRPNVVTKFSYQPETSGHIGDIASTFMSIRFDIATSDVIGEFMCEIDGYDVDDELTAVKTDPVIITERGVSYEDLLEIIVNLKNDEVGNHANSDLRLGLLEKAVRLLETQGKSRDKAVSSLANRLNLLSSDFLKISGKLLKTQQSVLADLQTIRGVNTEPRQAWPEGTYSLLNTTSGCPDSYSFDWMKNHLRITTQRGNGNRDRTSAPTHLAQPVLEKSGNFHYVAMRFCSKSADVAGPAWPKGSYCINDLDGTCPENLFPGNVTIDRENVGSGDTNDLASVFTDSDVTVISYCCRNDGDAEHPVLLPAKNPFFLYRHGGQCQEVIGMDVSDEYIFMDTKETNDNFSNAFHPDLTTRNIKLQLCYYTPKA